jgi:hypothetical protein
MQMTSSMPQRMRALLLAIAMFGVSVAAIAGGGVFISVAIAPPPIPVYSQPLAPGPGYIWTPGYWAYGAEGYYWVPGAWALPPYVGALWTPGYWGWTNGLYVWNPGYWGTRVGFYGGINYGFGYTGSGYYGGHWRGNAFYYNLDANNVNRAIIHNTYSRTINYVSPSRVSYNGGTAGVRIQPNVVQRAYMRQPHTAATATQVQHERSASNQPPLLASVNHGRPAIAATGAHWDSGATPVAAPAGNAAANAGVHPPAIPPARMRRAAPAGASQQAESKVYVQPQSPRHGHSQGGPPAYPGNGAQAPVQAAGQRHAQVAPHDRPKGQPHGGPNGGGDSDGKVHHGR